MTMSEHKHRQPVEGCHRCNLNRDEMAQQQQDELLASLVGGPPSPWQTLHDIAEVLSALIGEFSDVKEKVTLLEAMQKVLDVALANDERGGYGIYPAVGEEGVVEEPA